MNGNTPRIIRANELSGRLSVSRTTIWRWERLGHLPKRRRIGPNVSGWFEHEIEAWLALTNEPEQNDDIG